MNQPTRKSHTPHTAMTEEIHTSECDQIKVLAGSTRRFIWNYQRIGQFERLRVPLSLDFDTLVASIGIAKQLALGHVKLDEMTGLKTRSKIGDIVLSVRPREFVRGPRRYIPVDLGVQGFFERLNDLDVRYAVLRWFDEIPDLPPGEDVDLLVDDGDIPAVEALLANSIDGIPLDLYSVSGLPGTNYKGLAYYPPKLARQLLEKTIWDRKTYRVPDPRHHFLSLAHHVVFHKGSRADLSKRGADDERGTSHDYEATLRGLATELEIPLEEITLDNLYSILKQEDWLVPRDTLERLGLRNDWLKSKIDRIDDDSIHQGLSVFLIRERAVEFGLRSLIIAHLERLGFTILHQEALDTEARQRLTNTTRGGNWGRGPWDVSGGAPSILVVAYDLIPQDLTPWERKWDPLVTNARLLSKGELRKAVNDQLPTGQQCNVIHSTDHGTQAIEYIKIWNDAAVDGILKKVHDLSAEFETPQPVLASLTDTGRRAKHEIIEFQGGPAVKKTFRPASHDLMAREIDAAETFSWRPEFPQILARGDNYLIYPYFEDILQPRLKKGRLIPVEIARQAIEILQFLYHRGYALVSSSPSNLIVDKEHGLKLMNTGYLHKYQHRPPSFYKSYDIAGIPDHFEGSRPPTCGSGKSGFQDLWFPQIGVSLEDLLSGDINHLQRQTHQLCRMRTQMTERHIRPAGRWVKHWFRQLDGLIGIALLRL